MGSRLLFQFERVKRSERVDDTLWDGKREVVKARS